MTRRRLSARLLSCTAGACRLTRLLGPAAAAPFTDPPPATDKWLPGYAIRYAVRIQDPAAALLERQTVQVAIPTGGWLKPDASDVRVVRKSTPRCSAGWRRPAKPASRRRSGR